MHRLAPTPGESLRPRRSQGLTEVNGKPVRFYWCLVCNRCLPHWRSAFCRQHLADYKRLRRRQREGKTGAVRIQRVLVERLLDSALEVLRADHRVLHEPGEETLQQAEQCRAGLVRLILDEFSRHA